LRRLHSFEHALGLVDLLLELGVAGQVGLDLLEAQIDEHASDLGSQFAAGVLLHEVENSVADRLVEHGVVSLDRGDEFEARVNEALFVMVDGGTLVSHHLLLLAHLLHRHGHGGLRPLHLLLLSLILGPLTLVPAVLSLAGGHALVHVGVAASVLRAVILTAVVLVVVGLVCGALVLAALTLLLVGHAAELLLEGEGLEELRDLEVELVAGGDFVPLRVVVVQLLESLETELIFGLLVGDCPVLGQLVVADGELTSVDGDLGKLLESDLGLVGGLVADKGVRFG